MAKQCEICGKRTVNGRSQPRPQRDLAHLGAQPAARARAGRRRRAAASGSAPAACAAARSQKPPARKWQPEARPRSRGGPPPSGSLPACASLSVSRRFQLPSAPPIVRRPTRSTPEIARTSRSSLSRCLRSRARQTTPIEPAAGLLGLAPRSGVMLLPALGDRLGQAGEHARLVLGLDHQRRPGRRSSFCCAHSTSISRSGL